MVASSQSAFFAQAILKFCFWFSSFIYFYNSMYIMIYLCRYVVITIASSYFIDYLHVLFFMLGGVGLASHDIMWVFSQHVLYSKIRFVMPCLFHYFVTRTFLFDVTIDLGIVFSFVHDVVKIMFDQRELCTVIRALSRHGKINLEHFEEKENFSESNEKEVLYLVL